MSLDKLVLEIQNAHKEMQPDLNESAEKRWLSKEVLNYKVLDDCNNLDNLTHHGVGTVEMSDVRSHSGNKSVMLTVSTDIDGITPRPTTSLHLDFKKEDWQKYNRISLWVYPESVGFQNFYFHFSLMNKGSRGHLHAPSLTPNTWNHVIWEIGTVERNAVLKLSMSPYLMGCPPEAEPVIKVFFDDIRLEVVEPDYEEGWNIDERIAYSHSGYPIKGNKIALTQVAKNSDFELFDNEEKLVYSGKVQTEKSDLGEFFKLDFSEFNNPGEYFLKIDNRRTHTFVINDNPYEASIWKSINFLRLLRCGDDVQNVHSPCHLNTYTCHPDGRLVPSHGGWHDAGDVSQFEICTAEMAHAIVELAEKFTYKNPQLSERLLEEARYGLNWLLRTRFGDGYRALAVHYSIWKKNTIKNSDAFNTNNVAENGPFENFLASAAEAAAARVFKNNDDIFADWCLRSAIEDYHFAVEGHKQGLFTKRWGEMPDSLVYGAAALTAAELYTVTEDEKYLEDGNEFALKILACQQRDLPKWEVPLRGFFYEDPKHEKLLTFEHRGHEQTPIHGLVRLLEVAPDHPNAKIWLEGVELYKEYIKETANSISPYNLLPAHVYEASKLNLIRFTVPASYGTPVETMESFKRQIAQGIRLDKDIYLRRLPIAIQRRGYHATLLSKTKAVSAMASLLKDNELKQIAYNQIEWIMGKNPFASSSMYGEGHNYHPLYVAFSRQMVGALPVGFETLGDADAPYWPVANNAVYKEIWGHTTGKFLWVLADLV